MTTQDTRKLVERVIEADLLAPDALLEPEAPAAPTGYELSRCIGRGGGGEVWLAHDRTLDRHAAIKYLTVARTADLERFRREARFAARINNPAIVPVYELGEVEGRPYIAMQYIDGGNLDEAELGLDELVRVAREVAVALHHAHAEGIVHRDIKPANILLDRARRVYLTDFGIARSLRAELGETISSEGQIIGTPALMPPEQARGEVQAVDARSDLYSLGATLFYKLTGRYPFSAPSVVDVLHSVIHDVPPLVRTHNTTVPRGLEAIVARCMRKSREDRYQSAMEVVDDIDRFQGRGRVGNESSAWFRRLVGAPEPPAPTDEGAGDPEWGVGMEIVRELTAWDADLYRVSGSLSRSFSRLDAIRSRLDAVLADRPETAWARFYRGVVLFRRGRLDEAQEEMERAIDRVPNRAGAFFELGRLYLAQYLKQHQRAHKHMTQSGVTQGLEDARGLLEQAVTTMQEAQRLRGELAAWHADYVHAVTQLAASDYAACIAVCDEILESEPDLEEVWKLRGDAQRLAGADPFESYGRAIDVRRSYFEAMHSMAEAHIERRQFDEAREALQRACHIHPEYADTAALLARAWFAGISEGAPAEADDALAECLRSAGRAIEFAPDHYDALVLLAETRLQIGRRRRDDESLAGAHEMLDRASRACGCQNRVNLLRSRVLLEQARRARAVGGDARSQLENVAELCALRSAAGSVADDEPWGAVRREMAELE